MKALSFAHIYFKVNHDLLNSLVSQSGQKNLSADTKSSEINLVTVTSLLAQRKLLIQ